MIKEQSHIYSPIIKEKGFCPNPVAGNIPIYANTFANPKCKGTAAHQEFWEEQVEYCTKGYTTGGLFVPPKMYYFLNFDIIDGIAAGKRYPLFIDLQYELFRTEYEVRNDRSVLGMNIPKARQKGLSFFGVLQINHGMRFVDFYRAGVASGLVTYVDSFRNKVYRTYNNTVHEFKMNHLRRNDEELIIGYRESTEQGDSDTINAHILFRTMGDSAKKFEGENFNDYISEETGEFPLAEQALTSILPAIKSGEYFMGKMFFYGTGGNMSKGGKTFQNIYHNHKAYSLVNMFIPGRRYYFPYFRYPKSYDIDKPKTPILDELQKKHGYSDEQLLGCEDPDSAQITLDEIEKNLSKNPDKKQLIEHRQNFPKKVEDVFTSSGSNNYNSDILYTQLFRIGEQEKKYSKYVLEWVKDSAGGLKIPLEVIARPASETDNEWEICYILKGGLPKPEYKNLDIIGIDGYNEDKTTSSRSLGAIAVLRRNDKILSPDDTLGKGIVPVFIYYSRPPRKEKFFEISLKTAVLYKAIRNTMVSAESDLIIKYFQDWNCGRLLSKRPKTFDSPNSEMNHEFGAKMTVYSKPRMIAISQTFVEDNTQFIWFEDICRDYISYDTENIGTDWDLADAIGLALMRIYDMKISPQSDSEYDDRRNRTTIIEWKTIDGEKVPVEKTVLSEKEAKDKPWLKLPSVFDEFEKRFNI